jgi:hypothetical protein
MLEFVYVDILFVAVCCGLQSAGCELGLTGSLLGHGLHGKGKRIP